MSRMAALMAVVVVTTAAALTAGAAAEAAAASRQRGCNCDAVKLMHAPVCASDGNTYINRCLAVCQGVAVAHANACTAASGAAIAAADAASGAALLTALDGGAGLQLQQLGAAAAAAATAAAGFAGSGTTVGRQQMMRYADEGMVLVGRMHQADSFDGAAVPPITSDKRVASPAEHVAAVAAVTAVTLDDGCIYKYRDPIGQVLRAAARLQAAAADNTGKADSERYATDGFVPPADVAAAETAPDARHDGVIAAAIAAAGGASPQTVFGRDERTQITSPQGYPLNTVGLISFTVDKISKGCTGALIGPQAVLTAAHCVCSSRNKNVTASSWSIAFDHLASGPDARYGWVAGRRLFFSANFWTPEWWLWDIAVVVLDKPIGDQIGYLGYGWSPAGVTGGLATAGYPGDKQFGSLWYIDASVCRVNATDGSQVLLPHKCDVYPGQSGSPMWEAVTSKAGQAIARRVRAVVNAENAEYNSAMLINEAWYNFISQRRLLKL